MKRILIIGNSGAGKSTLARKIHDLTQLPLVHLDQHYWQPGWVETDLEIWRQKIQDLIAKEEWIMDGNYGSSLITRLQRADTVILLEVPTWKAMYRVIRRAIRYRGKSRPDMQENCPEKIDFSFLHYVLTYRLVRRPNDYRKLRQHAKDKVVHVLKSEREIKRFLDKTAAGIPSQNALS